MRNLKFYSGQTLDFFDLVLQSKRNTKLDPNYKERVGALRNQIEGCFATYDTLFDDKNLANAECAHIVDPQKADLLKLYSYDSRKIQELKIEVTTLEGNRILNTCQNCTINEVNSFDHFLPKNEFPEFVVNPRNLVPSCSNCNGRKTVIWKCEDGLLFLNIYLDELPNEQFLFANVSSQDNVISVEFIIDNRNHINDNLFRIIESHYLRLELPERFRVNSHSVVTELENSIKSQSNNLSRLTIVETIEEKVRADKVCFGNNYWKAVLEQALANSNVFMDSLFP